VGVGEVLVESVCACAEIKPKNTLVLKKNFLNIVVELKFKNGKGVAD
jgi:hypothetical protein